MKTPLLSALVLSAFVAACSDSDTDGLPAESAARAVADDGQIGTSGDALVAAAALDGELDIVATAVENGSFTTLAAALEATGLDTVLADPDATYTVFAPTDEAFAKLGDETIAALLNDTEALTDILLYHVVLDVAVDAETAFSLAGTSVATAGGGEVAISRDGDRLFVNASEVVVPDVVASNGIIHAIDTVLTPPVDMEEEMAAPDAPTLNIVETAEAAGGFETLLAALRATGFLEVLSIADETFTVFAPTDEAFAALGEDTVEALLADPPALARILSYHVIRGQAVDAATAISLAGTSVQTIAELPVALELRDGELFVNDSRVIVTDIVTTNGIIHVIDAVLTPPADMEEMAENDAPTLNIVETAEAAGGFETLLAALRVTGLDVVLSLENDTYTVFAPTDEAFAALGEDTVEALLADPPTLANILAYHVIRGQAVDAETAISLAGTSVDTLAELPVALELRDGELFVNDSRVIVTDIATTNGIIHVIDAVLTPPTEGTPDDGTVGEGETPVTGTPETPTGTILDVAREAGFSTLVAAVEATGLVGPLTHPLDFYTVFAPTDEAFAALGQDTIDALLADPAALEEILRYHILPGNVIPSSGLPDILGFDIQTGNGEFVQFGRDDGGFLVNDARILVPDVQAVNGVIHVIDQVLLPPVR